MHISLSKQYIQIPICVAQDTLDLNLRYWIQTKYGIIVWNVPIWQELTTYGSNLIVVGFFQSQSHDSQIWKPVLENKYWYVLSVLSVWQQCGEQSTSLADSFDNADDVTRKTTLHWPTTQHYAHSVDRKRVTLELPFHWPTTPVHSLATRHNACSIDWQCGITPVPLTGNAA